MEKSRQAVWLAVLIVLQFGCGGVLGHGRLIEPPSRSSMWRYGFDNLPNYTDHELSCGGVARQWDRNGGKCGVCGDPWDVATPRPNEAGGLYGNGIIVRNYQPGQLITIVVQLTASHLGWFEFRLCVHNDIDTPITHECLDLNLLELEDGTTRWTDIPSPKNYTIKAKLPPGVTCSQCVLQWKYSTGNSWGTPEDGTGAEQFYGCADVSIGDVPPPATTTSTAAPAGSTTTTAATTTTTTTKAPTTTPIEGATCHAIGDWLGDPGMDQWCVENCAIGNCPETHCSCTARRRKRSLRRQRPGGGNLRPLTLKKMLHHRRINRQ